MLGGPQSQLEGLRPSWEGPGASWEGTGASYEAHGGGGARAEKKVFPVYRGTIGHGPFRGRSPNKRSRFNEAVQQETMGLFRMEAIITI